MERLLAPEIMYTFLLFVFAAALLLIKSFRKARLRLPPGPRQLPVIGSLHHLLSGGQLPYCRLRDLAKEHGGIMYLQLGQIPTLVISSPDAAREIMKTHDRAFASRPLLISPRLTTYGFRDVVFAPYGEYWRAVKKMCTVDLLSTKRVQSYSSIREDEVSALVEFISSSAAEPVNLSAKLSALTNAVTFRSSAGSSNKHQEVMLACMDEVLRVSSGFNLADLFPSLEAPLLWISGTKRVLMEVLRNMSDLMDQVIAEHTAKLAARGQEGGGKGESEEDLLDILMRHYEQQDLGFEFTINDVKAIFQDIFFAGTDTSSSTMEWAMSELMLNSEAMHKVQTEVRQVYKQHGKLDETVIDQLHYLKLVIYETLRLHPPVPLLLPRECIDAVTIGDYDIPKGARVLINIWAIGRDPKHWEDPDEFKPERFLNENEAKSGPVVNILGTDFRFLPFGAGRRMCPGATFGLVVVEITLARMLLHFDWKLPKGDKCAELNMEEKFGATLSRKVPLRLIAKRHFS